MEKGSSVGELVLKDVVLPFGGVSVVHLLLSRRQERKILDIRI